MGAVRKPAIWRRRAVGLLGTMAVLSVGLGLAATPASAAGSYATTGTVNVRTGPGTSYGVITSMPTGAGFTLLCQWQGGTSVNGNATWDRVRFGNGVVGAISDYYTTTPSWNSFAPGTGDCVSAQMRNAVNWAIAEKNSPDPTWSDHYGHAWSGWCEQFVEQAEGFAFRFPSAIDDYNWQKANGRIETDAYPPAGALVYYGGGGGFGHVAVSIGGGQAIGTLGYVGQRLPVSQYAVVGQLSNPYLGWARPIGS
ncbi:MAG: SH3 domain-containing protein [Gaiellaceae bacterium]